MKKIILLILLILSTFSIFTVFAYELDKDDKIYVGGESIGIKLNTGVTVIGSYGIYEDGKLYKPWYDAGIREGDKIVSLNNSQVTDIKSLLYILSIVKNNKVVIKLSRDNNIIESTIKPVLSENNYSLGLYVKDSIVGVGTLTYYIKEANIFGSLGHKITDEDSYGGLIYEAKVNKIIKKEYISKFGLVMISLIITVIKQIRENQLCFNRYKSKYLLNFNFSLLLSSIGSYVKVVWQNGHSFSASTIILQTEHFFILLPSFPLLYSYYILVISICQATADCFLLTKVYIHKKDASCEASFCIIVFQVMILCICSLCFQAFLVLLQGYKQRFLRCGYRSRWRTACRFLI